MISKYLNDLKNSKLIILIFSILFLFNGCGKKFESEYKSKVKDKCSSANLAKNILSKDAILAQFECFEFSNKYPYLYQTWTKVPQKSVDSFFIKENKAFFSTKIRRKKFSRLLKNIIHSGQKNQLEQIVTKLIDSGLLEVTKEILDDPAIKQEIINLTVKRNSKVSQQNLKMLISSSLAAVRSYPKLAENFFKKINISDQEIIFLLDELSKANREQMSIAFGQYFFVNDLNANYLDLAFDAQGLNPLQNFLYFHINNLDSLSESILMTLNEPISCRNTSNNLYSLDLKAEARFAVPLFTKSYEQASEMIQDLYLKFLYLKVICPFDTNSQFEGKSIYFQTMFDELSGVMKNDKLHLHFAQFIKAINSYYQDELGFKKYLNSELKLNLSQIVKNNFSQAENSLLLFQLLQKNNILAVNQKVAMSLPEVIKSDNADDFFRLYSQIPNQLKVKIIKMIKSLSESDLVLLINLTHQLVNDLSILQYQNETNEESLQVLFDYFKNLDFIKLKNELIKFNKSQTMWKILTVFSEETRLVKFSPRKKPKIKNQILIQSPGHQKMVKCQNEFQKIKKFEDIFKISKTQIGCFQNTSSLMTNFMNTVFHLAEIPYDQRGEPILTKPSFVMTLMELANALKAADLINVDPLVARKDLLYFYQDKKLDVLLKNIVPVLRNTSKLVGDKNELVKQFRQMPILHSQQMMRSFSQMVNLDKYNSSPELHRKEYDCSLFNPRILEMGCVDTDFLLSELKRLTHVIYLPTTGEDFIQRLVRLIHPKEGIDSPLYSRNKYVLPLKDFFQFLDEYGKIQTTQEIIFNLPTGSFRSNETLLSRLEIIIREISFSQNYYGSHFKNQIAPAPNYTQKVQSLYKYLIGLDKFSGVYRMTRGLPKDSKYNIKNVINNFDALVQIGKMSNDQFHHSDVIQSLLSLVVGSSDKSIQKFIPANPKPSKVKKHKGIFISILTQMSFMKHLRNYIEHFTGGFQALYQSGLIAQVESIFNQVESATLIKFFHELGNRNIEMEMITKDFINLIKDLKSSEVQQIEKTIYEFVQLLSSNNSIKLDFVFDSLLQMIDHYPQLKASYQVAQKSHDLSRDHLFKLLPLINEYLKALTLESTNNKDLLSDVSNILQSILLNFKWDQITAEDVLSILKMITAFNDFLIIQDPKLSEVYQQKLLQISMRPQMLKSLGHLLKDVMLDDEFAKNLNHLFNNSFGHSLDQDKKNIDEFVDHLLITSNIKDYFEHVQKSMIFVE